MRHIGLSVLLSLTLAACAHGEAISVWNFNDAVPGATGGTQEFLVDRGTGTMTSDFIASSIGNAAGSGVNADGGDPAGQALRLSGYANNGMNLTWMVSTAGFASIDISFAAQRTSTGFANNQFLYSIDSGINWISFGDFFNPSTTFAVQNFDLSGILGLNDNPNAGFRIVFGGATSATGNNRIDNLLVSGTPVPPDTTPVPEPSTIGLMTAGMACAFVVRVKRRGNPFGVLAQLKNVTCQNGGRQRKPLKRA